MPVWVIVVDGEQGSEAKALVAGLLARISEHYVREETVVVLAQLLIKLRANLQSIRFLRSHVLAVKRWNLVRECSGKDSGKGVSKIRRLFFKRVHDASA